MLYLLIESIKLGDLMNNNPAACPTEITLTLIGDKWKILIIKELLKGPKRFGELQTCIGSISQKVLTSKLREMERCNLVVREVFAQAPPKVEYSLSPLGKSLHPIINAITVWGISYLHTQVI